MDGGLRHAWLLLDTKSAGMQLPTIMAYSQKGAERVVLLCVASFLLLRLSHVTAGLIVDLPVIFNWRHIRNGR